MRFYLKCIHAIPCELIGNKFGDIKTITCMIFSIASNARETQIKYCVPCNLINRTNFSKNCTKNKAVFLKIQ